jgi:hypothetical protein
MLLTEHPALQGEPDLLTSNSESEMLMTCTALLNLVRGELPTVRPRKFLDDRPAHFDELINEAGDRLEPLTPIGKSSGLNAIEYVHAYISAFTGNRKALNNIIRRSEMRMRRDKVVSSIESRQEKRKMKFGHKRIIKELLEDIPISSNPTLTIVAGPFAGGKTEIIERLLKNEKSLIIDLDVIRQLLMEGYDPTDQAHVQRVRKESWIVSDMLLKKALKTGRSVIIQSALHRKERWINDEALLYAKRNGIPVKIEMILRPITDCIIRNLHRDRKTALKDLLESMNGMSVIIDLMRKFGKPSKEEDQKPFEDRMFTTVLLDFHPLVKKEQVFLPKMFRDLYEKLIKFASNHPNMRIVDMEKDLSVLVNA